MLLTYRGSFASDLRDKGIIMFNRDSVEKKKYQIKVVGDDFATVSILALDFLGKLRFSRNINHAKVCVVEKGVVPNVKKKHLLSVAAENGKPVVVIDKI